MSVAGNVIERSVPGWGRRPVEQAASAMDDAVVGRTSPGDRVPACCGMTAGRAFYSIEEQFGRPAVLILTGAEALPGLSAAIGGIARCLDAFAVRGADVLLMVDDNPAWLWPDDPLPIRTIDCGDFLRRCGVDARQSALLVLDRNVRIAMRSDVHADAVTACLDCLDALPREEPRDAPLPAPVIVLPNLLPRPFCQDLIDLFESSVTIDGTVSRIDADGTARNVVDHAKKRRRDMRIAPEDDLHRTLEHLLLSRCAPEIAKAFQVNVTHIDRILVSRYDDSGGWFRRHRDNTADNVAFREFAISVNLNTEGYEGGHLLFPEYNDHRYSPPTGGGLIFSAGILHEAAPVTAGLRYVLLTFFHSDAAEARRLAGDAGTL
ncbi:2OG-Fe(II) oxygenase [Acidisphaera sp. S103]|uniref:2OG-Fe(II) oxygenase family protein n=1 Tax=Acidisphaera sp. S103 TaxID=1747223 RepID=UPI00131D73D4|nr:2OG-Fe(II) oxygenase [Acidisphaera sp. S103]